MKFYYFYIPSDLARSGAMFLIFFITFSIFFLLITINFRFRVNRTRKKTKNEAKPLLYVVPRHVEHAKKYIDPNEYFALKGLVFNEREGHFMKKNIDFKAIKYSTKKDRRPGGPVLGNGRGSRGGLSNKESLVALMEDKENEGDKANAGSLGRKSSVSKFYGQSFKSLRRLNYQ